MLIQLTLAAHFPGLLLRPFPRPPGIRSLTDPLALRGTLWRKAQGQSSSPLLFLGKRGSGGGRSLCPALAGVILHPPSLCRPSPVHPRGGEWSLPVRTAKAERRHQERLRMQSPELLSAAPETRELSPAERRALEAEKRAMWRAAR